MTTDAKRVIEVQQLSAEDLKPLTILRSSCPCATFPRRRDAERR